MTTAGLIPAKDPELSMGAFITIRHLASSLSKPSITVYLSAEYRRT
jgi:hypothetical protein